MDVAFHLTLNLGVALSSSGRPLLLVPGGDVLDSHGSGVHANVVAVDQAGTLLDQAVEIADAGLVRLGVVIVFIVLVKMTEGHVAVASPGLLRIAGIKLIAVRLTAIEFVLQTGGDERIGVVQKLD